MELMEAIKGRRSVRRFSGKPVSREDVEAVLEAGRWAPSAGNLQARDFFVVEGDRALKEKLAKASLNQRFVADAPVVIVICANRKRIEDYGERGAELYCVQDASASCQNMLLAIHSLGLGACWVGAFDEGAVSEALGLEPHMRPVAIIPFGHPAAQGRPPARRTDDVHRLG